MLIPFYDVNPRIAAQLVPNGYVNKLIVEAYQMLYAASWYHFPMARKAPGYFNHPFTVWASQSQWAWDWLIEFARACALDEAPKRYGTTKINAAWQKIQALPRPTRFIFTTMQETPLCPLPAAALQDGAVCHADRAAGFRAYHRDTKNKDTWQFLWEPRTRRPDWMPKRTHEQDEVVEKIRKRMKKSS